MFSKSWIFFLLAFAAFVPKAEAQGNTTSSMPAGYYVYLGAEPGKFPQVRLRVTKEGSVVWQKPEENSQQGQKDYSNSEVGQSQQNQATAETSNIESYEYPKIKWKPKLITEVPGAIAQLLTTFEQKSQWQTVVKYKLTLFKVPQIPTGIEIELVDQDGFKLTEFHVYSESFHQISANLVEATGSLSCAEKDYARARDFNIKARVPTTYRMAPTPYLRRF